MLKPNLWKLKSAKQVKMMTSAARIDRLILRNLTLSVWLMGFCGVSTGDSDAFIVAPRMVKTILRIKKSESDTICVIRKKTTVYAVEYM